MGDLEVQKRLWGRDGHGIPGANPNYATRSGLGAIAIAIVLIVGFVIVTDHAPKTSETEYYGLYRAYVVNGAAMQSQVWRVFHDSPGAGLSAFEHELAGALAIEDQNLSSLSWPMGVERDVEKLLTLNQRLISVLNKYPSASASERASLLKEQITDVSRSNSYNATIRDTFKRSLSRI